RDRDPDHDELSSLPTSRPHSHQLLRLQHHQRTLWLEQFNLILRCSRLPYYLYCLRSHALNQIKLLQPYQQCTNINCGHTFITMETFVRSIVKPQNVQSAPPHPAKNAQVGFCFEVGGVINGYEYR
ncbi:Ogr/Delta-like zinc finger protein, partial [Candidatus Regiella insecticola 5.15]